MTRPVSNAAREAINPVATLVPAANELQKVLAHAPIPPAGRLRWDVEDKQVRRRPNDQKLTTVQCNADARPKD